MRKEIFNKYRISTQDYEAIKEFATKKNEEGYNEHLYSLYEKQYAASYLRKVIRSLLKVNPKLLKEENKDGDRMVEHLVNTSTHIKYKNIKGGNGKPQQRRSWGIALASDDEAERNNARNKLIKELEQERRRVFRRSQLFLQEGAYCRAEKVKDWGKLHPDLLMDMMISAALHEDSANKKEDFKKFAFHFFQNTGAPNKKLQDPEALNNRINNIVEKHGMLTAILTASNDAKVRFKIAAFKARNREQADHIIKAFAMILKGKDINGKVILEKDYLQGEHCEYYDWSQTHNSWLQFPGTPQHSAVEDDPLVKHDHDYSSSIWHAVRNGNVHFIRSYKHSHRQFFLGHTYDSRWVNSAYLSDVSGEILSQFHFSGITTALVILDHWLEYLFWGENKEIYNLKSTSCLRPCNNECAKYINIQLVSVCIFNLVFLCLIGYWWYQYELDHPMKIIKYFAENGDCIERINPSRGLGIVLLNCLIFGFYICYESVPISLVSYPVYCVFTIKDSVCRWLASWVVEVHKTIDEHIDQDQNLLVI